MKKILLIIIVIACSSLFLQKCNRDSAIKCTREWARLAPFPKGMNKFEISTGGNMFTREFHCSFYAPKIVILKWMKKCPGLRKIKDFTRRNYNIMPGGGAQKAEVNIDWSKNKVSIYTYWS